MTHGTQTGVSDAAITDTELHRVSVIVPCRQEARYIGPFLDSLLETTWPRDRLEILVVDGASDDGTRDILRDYARRHPHIRVLDNPMRTTPAALNIGLAAAGGDIIVRMDVHAEYPPHYIATLVDWLDRTGVDNVGGVAITCPAAGTPGARAIAHALGHPIGVGNSWFRIGVTEPREVDTVPFGCYRRETFDRIGGFDEDLVRNQDDELNARLRRAGGRILLVPDVTVRYYARDTFRKLWRMYFQYGLFKPLSLRRAGSAPAVRQMIPAIFVLALVGTAVAAALGFGLPLLVLASAWLAVTIHASVRSIPRIGLAAAALLPAAFATIHVAYGAGCLGGLLRLRSGGRVGATRSQAMPMSR